MDNKFDYSLNLDDYQREAVEAKKGYTRVIAGAGSGKTRVLTYRFANLVKNGRVPADRIACITFTQKAAKEMGDRIHGLIGKVPEYIRTFNSLGNTIIREEMYVISWLEKPDLLQEESDVYDVLKSIYKKYKITTRDFTYEAAACRIRQLKSDDDYLDFLDPEKDPVSDERILGLMAETNYFDALYYAYLNEQRKRKFIDFTDQVRIPLILFDRYPNIREKWQNKFDFVMVDEFQDVSKDNYRFCDMKKRKDQDRLKRWYEKGFWGVYKLNCSVCGTEFYTVNSSQPVCNQEKCRTKWENLQQVAEQKNEQLKRKKVHI